MPFRALVLLAVCLLATWPQLTLPDWVGTEGRRVQIAFEMATSGDWMVPTLGGEPTFAKPPLHYWLLGLCGKVFGFGFVPMRLPAVLGHWLLAVLAMQLLRRQFGDRVGWYGALGVLLAPLCLFAVPSAEIDPLFASLTAASLWCLAAGVARERDGHVVASGVLGGLAFLQKGPVFFVFAAGAWLVWWRHRRLHRGWQHFGPLLLLAAAYYVPLLLRVPPAEFLATLREETLSRVSWLGWRRLVDTPVFWLKAVAVQLPFVLWCFWEWRSRRDVRMDAQDLLLRMCSGGAVFAVVLMTFAVSTPTRYLLPNVALFTFAVAPAVAHFAGQERQLGGFSVTVLRMLALVGAAGLLAVPFLPAVMVPRAPVLALVAAALPWLVQTPRQLVACCLWLPVVAAWTVLADRAATWVDTAGGRTWHGAILARELQGLGGDTGRLATWGHVQSGAMLGMGLPAMPPGSEHKHTPTRPFLLFEAPRDGDGRDLATPGPDGWRERVRVCTPAVTYVLAQRGG